MKAVKPREQVREVRGIKFSYSHTITGNHLIANKAQISKELMIMILTISQTTFLVMTMTEERFLTFGTNKMLQKINIHKHTHIYKSIKELEFGI